MEGEGEKIGKKFSSINRDLGRARRFRKRS